MSKGKYPHIVLPPGQAVTVGMVPVEPVFHLDGFDYYYQELTKVYWAVDPKNPNATMTFNGENPQPLKLQFSSFNQIKHCASFAFGSQFETVKPVTKPVAIRLLAVKQMIQVHQIMMS